MRYCELILGMGLCIATVLKSPLWGDHAAFSAGYLGKVSSEQPFFFFLNLRLNGDKMIHNMSKLLKFLISTSGPKPQRIIAKLPLDSQGSWWSWFTEHPGWGEKFFLKRACGNHSWASWDSNWCLSSPVFLRLKKEKSSLDTKEKQNPKSFASSCFINQNSHLRKKFNRVFCPNTYLEN